MRSQPATALIYAIAAIASAVGAYFVYPLFTNQAFRGFSDPPVTVVVFQDGSLGNVAPSVRVRIDARDGPAHVEIDQVDVSGRSTPGATTYVGLERQQEGYSFGYSPLSCTTEVRDGPSPRIGTGSPRQAWDSAETEGAAGTAPSVIGDVTTVTLAESVTTVKIDCVLPDFGFGRESLSNRNLYLPGVEVFGTGGSARPSVSYMVMREPSDYLAVSSNTPSETLAGYYTWYERNFDLLARQGLYLTIGNPTLQQESAYRLFIAGALLGMAGGFLVAAIQTALTRTRTNPPEPATN